MGKEIERKYRVTKVNRKMLRNGKKIWQGYLCLKPEVRVRIAGKQGFLTIKSEGRLQRNEYEYKIPYVEAEVLYNMCRWRITKTRYQIGRIELDVFSGVLKGLIIAEIELRNRAEKIKLPDDLEAYEVTRYARYKNKNLAQLKKPPSVK